MAALQLTHLDHCSVLITDVAKARAFYVDVLGLKEIPKPKTFDFVALWFQLGDGQTIHLLQKPQPDTRSPRHFALRVTDAKAAREHFRAHGVEIQETGPIPHCDRFFVHDPDGNRLELIRGSSRTTPARAGLRGAIDGSGRDPEANLEGASPTRTPTRRVGPKEV